MRINSIFKSINGEVSSNGQGRMTTFIRMQGCNLYSEGKKCSYCDTPFAFDPKEGKSMSLPSIIKKVKLLNCKYITITGGEPLFQRKELENLVKSLEGQGYSVVIETNGTLFPALFLRSRYVIDWKLKSSSVSALMKLASFSELRTKDTVKFVIETKDDFAEALTAMKKIKYTSFGYCDFSFSPVFGKIEPNDLLNWMKEANLNDAILNVQLHKLLNIAEPT